MKKIILIIILLLCNIIPSYAYLEHTCPDGFMAFVQVHDSTSIDLWIGDFRYPTELMVIHLGDNQIIALSTFTYDENGFTNFSQQAVMFSKFVNTRGFFVQMNESVLKIQNNYTGNIYKITWLGSWFYNMAPWMFTYWDSWLYEGYEFTDIGGKINLLGGTDIEVKL